MKTFLLLTNELMAYELFSRIKKNIAEILLRHLQPNCVASFTIDNCSSQNSSLREVSQVIYGANFRELCSIS
jgi:hypothetical protein